MPGSRGSEEAAKIGTLNTATRQLNLSLILYAVPCGPRPSSVAEWRLAVDWRSLIRSTSIVTQFDQLNALRLRPRHRLHRNRGRVRGWPRVRRRLQPRRWPRSPDHGRYVALGVRLWLQSRIIRMVLGFGAPLAALETTHTHTIHATSHSRSVPPTSTQPSTQPLNSATQNSATRLNHSTQPLNQRNRSTQRLNSVTQHSHSTQFNHFTQPLNSPTLLNH